MPLLKRAKEIPEQFEVLFRENFSHLTVLAIQYVKEQAVAEDIVQDLFLYIYEKKANTEWKGFPKNYLFTLVKYRCLNYLAHLKVERENNADAEKVLKSNPHDPLELAEQIELEHRYLLALEELPPGCKKVFELSRFKGKSNMEIAKELDLSQRTVETHISNALKKLKQILAVYLSVNLVLLIIKTFLTTYALTLTCYSIRLGA